jgi:hypothetical protein
MSATPVHEPSCEVRALAAADGRIRIVIRNLAFDGAGQLGLDPDARHPAALDYLVGALALDLVAGLAREARRAGIELDDVELRLSARLENPLVGLGVVGEAGSAALREVTGALYVASSAEPAVLGSLWENALAHAPVHSTLIRCADVRVQLKFTS